MDDKIIKLLDWLKKNKITTSIIGVIVLVGIFIWNLNGDIDNSKDKSADITASLEISSGKTVKNPISQSIAKESHMSGSMAGGNINRNTTNNITNNYGVDSKSKDIDIVYKDINITGKIVNKDNITEEISGMIVKLISPNISSNLSDDNGNFHIYLKQPTYKERTQIKIEETASYKEYLDDVDLNAQKIYLKLEAK